MTPEKIAALAGIVLSLVFSYVPLLNDWYDKLTPTPKRLLMLALLVLTALGSLLYTCRADLSACVALNFETYLTALVAAIIANQATYTLAPLSAERRLVRKQASERNVYPPVENRTNEPLR